MSYTFGCVREIWKNGSDCFILTVASVCSRFDPLNLSRGNKQKFNQYRLSELKNGR